MSATITRSPSCSTSGSVRQLWLSAFRRDHTLLSTVLRTMGNVGSCYAPARPLRYPRNAGHQDLTRIGWDMYRAMHAVNPPDA